MPLIEIRDKALDIEDKAFLTVAFLVALFSSLVSHTQILNRAENKSSKPQNEP